MGHPDFRLNGRIFATLSAQEKGCGMVKLTPEQQQPFVAELPQVFSAGDGWEAPSSISAKPTRL
jgi:hypothetical protein